MICDYLYKSATSIKDAIKINNLAMKEGSVRIKYLHILSILNIYVFFGHIDVGKVPGNHDIFLKINIVELWLPIFSVSNCCCHV